MKGLSIKGTVHIGSVDYKVLWSEIVKDFIKLPFGTQFRMIEQLVVACGSSEDINSQDTKRFVELIEQTKCHFLALKI